MPVPPRKFACGDILSYTRNFDGSTQTGEVRAIYEVGNGPGWGATGYWPKPSHCRYVYRLALKGGDRTVCECRLREAVTYPTPLWSQS